MVAKNKILRKQFEVALRNVNQPRGGPHEKALVECRTQFSVSLHPAIASIMQLHGAGDASPDSSETNHLIT
jgi:hypothetical protein